ncbi:MAG: aminotransferase class IV [Chitinophagaceae bacterium]|jgi:branched-chain amino acid aminotransferase|nr:aminotransferase class IV [Chitinophagaceae bacterium]
MLLWLDGKWLNSKNAAVSVDNRSFRYGDGFFETIKVVNGAMPLWPYHLKRLQFTAERLGFELPGYMSASFFEQVIVELASKNGHAGLARIRLTFFRGNGGLHDVVSAKPHVLIQSWPLADANNELNENGLDCIIYQGGIKAADSLANLKTNNYLLYALAALEAKRQKANDAWVLNHRQQVADSTIASIWVCKAGVWHTPPLLAGGVMGTMRQYLLDFLPANGYSVQQTEFSAEWLAGADAVFHSNAIYGIKWVKRVGELTFLPGTIPLLFDRVVKPLWGSTK